MRGVGALLRRPFDALEARRGRLFGFVPVGLGVGIGLWFALPDEPSVAAYAGGAALCPVMSAIALRWRLLAPVSVMVCCVVIGALACGLRVLVVAAPMLDGTYYGPITGRVIDLDRSQSGALRITMDRVWLERRDPARVPHSVRLSLHGDHALDAPLPGDVVMTTARLSAPEGPVEPGAFDFRRMAFFESLGAVGYTRVPVLLWQQALAGEERVGRLRSHLSGAIRSRIDGDAGAFAAGVLTGDRSGLSVEAVAALRDSSLAHLLAISGMNMAFLVAFTFGFLRYGLALVPPLALRVNSKKAAAAVSLGVACFYLLLSGANVATERAFIMVAVMLVAVLLDRRALTLRSVAIAGIILLLWQPEALLSPGFQMSFAATVALIVSFSALTDWSAGRQVPWLLRVGMTAVLASLVGGLSTAPYAAAHFNRFTDYGLLANLLTGPVMGLVVMPAGALAGLAAPFGLAGPPLWVMEMGCRWILFVAYEVAALEGSVTAIKAPPGMVLGWLSLGLLFIVLWSGRWRWMGLVPVSVALAMWVLAPRPAVLVGAGGIVGVMGPDGRALSAERGGGFMVRNWLENDGDLALQREAASRVGFEEVAGGRKFLIGGTATGLLVEGQVPADACMRHALLVVSAPTGLAGDCLQVTDAMLARSGTLALDYSGGAVIVTTTRADRRRWSPAAVADPVQ
ncbi:MAG: competence protein [Rhodobacter sp. CACIA14H1]|nr:MAG: competence protein [Rhodobacter sp. CACIA14H1]